MKGVELVHLYYKTWWEEFRATDDAGNSLMPNPSKAFSILFCLMRRAAILGWRFSVSLFVEDEGPKL